MSKNLEQYDKRIKERVKFMKTQSVDKMTPEILQKIADSKEHDEEDVKFAIQAAEKLNNGP